MRAEDAVYIGLGSNLGSRAMALSEAINRIENLDRTVITGLSPVYETTPVDMDGNPFYNAVVRVRTALQPETLHSHLLTVEREMGRKRVIGKKTARIIDIDLLLYGDRELNTVDLRIPHPELANRRFVLHPLSYLAPELRPPGADLTMSGLKIRADRLYTDQEIRLLCRVEELPKVTGDVIC